MVTKEERRKRISRMMGVDKSQNPKISFNTKLDEGERIVLPKEQLVQINTKIITANTLIGKGLKRKIKQKNIFRRLFEKISRRKKEDRLEEPEAKEANKLGLKLPGVVSGPLSWIKKFLTTVLLGWILTRMLKFLPGLIKILEPIAAIAGWLLKVGEFILSGLVTLVHWGYKAYDWTKGVVGKVFGEKGVERFDKISGVLNTVLNLQLSLTLAMIAFSNEFGSSLVGWGKGFMSIFKHGLRRAVPRLLIKMFGKKTAASLLGKGLVTKGAVTAGTVKGGAIVSTVKGGAATAAGVGGGIAAGVVAGAGLLASGLGEGIFQLGKKGYNIEQDWKQKAAEKWWTDPRKYWWGISAGLMTVVNRLFSFVGGILDVVGAPFRMIIELIRFPFLSEEDKKKQRDNLRKYDTRIREQFRKALNSIDFLGVISDDKNSWGSLYGPATKDTKDKKNKKVIDSVSKNNYEGLDRFASYDQNIIEIPEIEKTFKKELDAGLSEVSDLSFGGSTKEVVEELDEMAKLFYKKAG